MSQQKKYSIFIFLQFFPKCKGFCYQLATKIAILANLAPTNRPFESCSQKFHAEFIKQLNGMCGD